MHKISELATVAGICIVIFLVSLFLKRGTSQTPLVIILLCLIPFFLSYNSAFLENENWVAILLSFSNLSLLLIGPILYGYAQKFFSGDTNQFHSNKQVFGFASLISIIHLVIYLSVPKKSYDIALGFISIFCIIYFSVHLVLIIRYQWKSAQKLKYFYTSMKDKNLHWVNIFVIGFFVFIIFDLITGVILASSGFNGITIVNNTFLIILVWYVGYNGLTQNTISENLHDFKIPQKSVFNEDSLQPEKYEELKLQLIKVIEEKQLFQQEDISLGVLAEHLELPIKKVSVLLNQYMKISFYSLMNNYRINAFKSKVETGELENKTILALALESGFNSKASFNRVFKKNEGISPKEYIDSLK